MIGNMTALLTAGAMVLAPVGAAAKGSAACLSQDEFATIGTAMLPQLLDSLADRCRASLPATAELLRRDDARWHELALAADTARPEATEMVRVMLAKGDTPFPKELAKTGDLLSVAGAFVSSAIGENVKPTDCARINVAYTELTPLPPANLFRPVRLIQMSDKKPLVCPLGSDAT